jgi:tetratricopeptide (TPR) repeat protein/ADP-heptose:LPS heptosyltransferase
MRHHQAGELAQAEILYATVLLRQPSHSEAHHLLGLARFQQQDYAGALAALGRAVSLRPEAAYYRDFGMVLRAAGQLEPALAAYRQAAALAPGAPETYFNMGNVLAALQRSDEAAQAFRTALRLRPSHTASWQNLGAALLASRQDEAAITALGRALEQQPGHPVTLYNLGLALQRLERWPDAVAMFQAATAAGSAGLETALHLGQCLHRLDDLPAAETAFRHALALAPGSAEAWFGLGTGLRDLAAWDDAAEAFRNATRLRPNWPEAHYRLASVMQRQGKLEEAESALRAVLALLPNDIVALTDLGNVLTYLGWPEQALEVCRRVHALMPDDPLAQVQYARQLLMLGRLGEGWDLAVARVTLDAPRHDAGLPQWDGRPLPEGSLLLVREQGIGDEVMYASIVPELIAAGHQLTLLCEPRLRPIFARSFPEVRFHPEAGPATASIAIGDLPRLLRRREADFGRARHPYLLADPARRAELRGRYDDGRPLVGLAWHTRNSDAAYRAIPLASLAPLLALDGMRFVSLQYGDAAHLAAEAAGLPLLLDPSVDPLASAEDALAQVAAMDLVISIDNSTVHFAGALGIPCHALLPFNADWRWMRDRDDTPWYPGLRLLRQRRGEPWAATMARLVKRFA